MDDYIKCEAIGTISSKIKTYLQKGNKKMLMFKLNISIFSERVTIKMFDLDESKYQEIIETFDIGDKIRVIGEVKCDAYLNKDRVVKGICITPTEMKLLEKSNIIRDKELKILK